MNSYMGMHMDDCTGTPFRRICIIGPSCSGKSTLALALGRAMGCPVVHLDRLAHRPNSNWERVPQADFIRAHDAAIAGERWIIEGNYGDTMPDRLARADAVIWCDVGVLGFLWRYIMRSLNKKTDRPGGLEGAKREFNPALIRYTFFHYPKNRRLYKAMLEAHPHVKVLILKRFTDVKQACAYVRNCMVIAP